MFSCIYATMENAACQSAALTSQECVSKAYLVSCGIKLEIKTSLGLLTHVAGLLLNTLGSGLIEKGYKIKTLSAYDLKKAFKQCE